MDPLLLGRGKNKKGEGDREGKSEGKGKKGGSNKGRERQGRTQETQGHRQSQRENAPSILTGLVYTEKRGVTCGKDCCGGTSVSSMCGRLLLARVPRSSAEVRKVFCPPHRGS